MFGMLIGAGIKLLAETALDRHDMLVIAVSIGVGRVPDPGAVDEGLGKGDEAAARHGDALVFAPLGKGQPQVDQRDVAAPPRQREQQPTQHAAQRPQPGQRQARQRAHQPDPGVAHAACSRGVL